MNALTIHCTATPEGRDVSARILEEWAVSRFGQKSYHWIVLLDGAMHRGIPDDRRGAHVGGANTSNIGIAYVGGMDAEMRRAKDTRTAGQKKSLLTLVRTYIARYPGIAILGHRDWPGVKKDCPSFDVASWLKSEGLEPAVKNRYWP